MPIFDVISFFIWFRSQRLELADPEHALVQHDSALERVSDAGQLVVPIRAERLLDSEKRIVKSAKKRDRVIRRAPQVVRVHSHPERVGIPAPDCRDLRAIAIEIAG